jgi:Tfp pilus assembly protein PilF
MKPTLRFAKKLKQTMKLAVQGAAGFALIAAVACGTEEVKPQPMAQQIAAAPKAEASPEELYKTAQDRLAVKDYPGAQAQLDAALAKDPNNSSALFASGWIAEQQGKAPLAIANYKKCLVVEPGHLGAALNVARLYRLLDDYSDGEQVLRVAMQSHEGDPQVMNGLAGLLRLDKKLDEAESMVRRVLARHPDNADAYKNLALIEIDRGRPRLAEVALQSARKLDAKDPGISNNLGLLAWSKGDLVSAREKFNEALKLDASFAPAWANLGALALSYRDYAAASEAYAKATALEPNRWDEQLAYGWSLEGLKKPAEAQAAYEKVLALKAGQDDALYGKATSLKAQNKLPEAMAAFKSYAELPAGAHAKDAQGQIAQIDMRLKNPPKTASAPPDVAANGASLPPEDSAALPPANGQAPAPADGAPPAVAPAPQPAASTPTDKPAPAPAPVDKAVGPAGAQTPPAPENGGGTEKVRTSAPQAEAIK